ncbi:MAG: redoxin domain-containing protein [Deltaproteobacteria bacterium]|nr:redoxin domain-containing protein [Deltaproteobacteria bacterium]
MKKLILFVVLVLPIVALLYFSLTRNPRELPSALIDKPAPDFALQTLDGATVTLASLKGHPVVINFWSTWCGTCLGEHRLIRQAYQAMEPKGVALYSILYEDTPENAEKFMNKYGKAAPVLLDPGLKTAIDYGVVGVPETFFIDKEGIIRYKQAGMLTPDILWGEVEELQR